MANVGDQAAHEAMKHVGKPYVWNTRGPNTFDCSGLIHYVYGTLGKTISSGSYAQATVGTPVSDINQLRPGDILLYDWENNNTIGHTGIYVGNGQLVEAFNEERGVVLSYVNNPGHMAHYKGARRPFPYSDTPTSGDLVDQLVKALIAVLNSTLNAPSTNTHRVTTTVNMRSGPGVANPIKGVLSTGTLVNVINPVATQADGYTWYNVKSQQFGDGWIVNSIAPV